MAKLREYMCKVVYVFLSFCLCVAATGQNLEKNYMLHVQPVDTTPAFIQDLTLQENFPSVAGCLQYAQQLPAMLAAKGYVAESADPITHDSTGVQVKLF